MHTLSPTASFTVDPTPRGCVLPHHRMVSLMHNMMAFRRLTVDAQAASCCLRQVPIKSSSYGNWSQPARKSNCVADPGSAWEDRDDISCEVRWPQRRQVPVEGGGGERNHLLLAFVV